MTRNPRSALSRALAMAALACLASLAQGAPASPFELAAAYRAEVDRQLEVPREELQSYGRLVDAALAGAGVVPAGAQYLVVVDRDAQVQVLLVLWRSAPGDYQLVGASPVSTGRPGSFEHFETPTGVFDHTLANPDFRAEGTFNGNGIRGYGVKGMRVFDFGWQRAPKGWGDGAASDMRLQMHATDPDALEPRLGTAQSKGCVRIPATVNRFLDRYGVIDAEYERVQRETQKLWVLREDRQPVAGAGRYLVIVDSARSERPAWSPAPSLPHARPAPRRSPPPAPAPAPARPGQLPQPVR